MTLYWRSILFAIFVFSYPIFVFCFINEHERKHYNYCYNAICELGIILTLGKYCYSKWSAFKDRKTIAVFIFTLLSFTCFSIGDFGFYSNFIKESADTYMQGYLYEMCYTLTFGFMAVALILHFKIYTQHPLVIAGIVAISTMYFFLTYHFLIAPMYNIYYSHLPYYRYVDIIIYNIFSSIVLGISASYCLRTLNLVEFMFLHSLLFLLAFDLTETYQLIQVNIIHPQAIETTIAQFFWSLTVGSMFLIVFLSWLHGQILFSHKKNLTDWYSVRVSLGLFIFGMNMLFSLALLIIRRYTIHNAIDVSVLLTVILLCWSISNALAFKVSSKFTEIGALMGTHKVKDVDFNSSNGLRLENINKRLNFSSEMNFIIEQYNKMADQFNLRGKKLIEFTNKKLIAEKHIVKVQIANQLAHDIASPLEAIRTILTLPKLDTDITRETLWTALSSITDMVGRLHFRSSGEQNSELKVYSAAATVEKIFIMKLAEFSELQVSLKLNITPTALNSFFKIDLDSFRSILSNIINNSRDELAKIRKDGQIIIELKKEEEAIFISVSDNGSTISEARLQQLNDGSFNSSKHSYKPLGIRSAKENLNRYNGLLHFFRVDSTGLNATIKLPAQRQPEWLATEINLLRAQILVIFDDDESIHQMLRIRLISDPKLANIQLISCHTEDQFERLVGSLELENVLFLVDYEFRGSSKTGIDQIEHFKISRNSILMTSHWDEDHVIAECKTAQVMLFPKTLAHSVSIVTGVQQELDFILVDDNPILAFSWKKAAETYGLKYRIFSDPAYFKMHIREFANNVVLFLDFNLPGSTGIQLLESLNGEFENYYILTGELENNIPSSPFLDKNRIIFGKAFPLDILCSK